MENKDRKQIIQDAVWVLDALNRIHDMKFLNSQNRRAKQVLRDKWRNFPPDIRIEAAFKLKEQKGEP